MLTNRILKKKKNCLFKILKEINISMQAWPNYLMPNLVLENARRSHTIFGKTPKEKPSILQEKTLILQINSTVIGRNFNYHGQNDLYIKCSRQKIFIHL